MKPVGYIYKTTNLITNKIYIGQSHISRRGRYLGSGEIILKSIKKHGRENFEVERIELCYSIDELNDRERYWIAYYNSTDKSIGYNIAVGGFNTLHSEVTKDKIRVANIGKKFSDDHKTKIGKATSSRAGSNTGKQFSDEWKKNIGKASRARMVGTTRSAETKKSMSIARKLYWDKKLKRA